MPLLQTDFFRNALAADWVVRLLKAVVPPLDRFLLRVSRGWVNTAFQSVVLLETTGARSGQSRTTATLCRAEGDDLLLAGSNWGQARHPAWVYNLRKHPQARITFRGYRGPVTATELSGDERDQAWTALVAMNPQYQVYQDRVARQIPVIRLRKPASA